ncbi:MAG: hypothetical protein J2P18_12785 [Nocardia sp.]|nr:hypothetical protein [Nocardia sp.]
MTHTSGGILADGYHITFDWPIFFSQLFGFAVIVFIFVKWLLPLVKKMMKKSQDAIAQQLTESEQAASDLERAKQSYDKAVADAKTELEQIRADAHADADYIVSQMRDSAAEEVERVKKQGNDQLAQLRRQTVRDLEADLSAAMLSIAEEKVRNRVNTPEAKSESVERFLEDIELLANSSQSGRPQPKSRWN